MYPYILVCHLKTKKLCRHLINTSIPNGFVKVISYRNKLSKFKQNPYDEIGQLKLEYWSIIRDTDIQFREKLND